MTPKIETPGGDGSVKKIGEDSFEKVLHLPHNRSYSATVFAFAAKRGTPTPWSLSKTKAVDMSDEALCP